MSCQPVEDPVAPDISDQLTRHYCNDPYAVNFNDSFPGIPDNTRCYYPQDLVAGTWLMMDSIFRPDGEYLEYVEKEINLQPFASEERNIIHLLNWCSGSAKVIMIINKYGKIEVEQQLEFPAEGQIVCGSDTLMGNGQRVIKDTDTLLVMELTEHKNSGQIKIHKITSYKQ